MAISSLSLVLGIIGAVGTIVNQIVRAVEKRRGGHVDERRLDVEGLRTLVQEQREELDDHRASRREDHARIDELEAKVRDLTRQLAKANDTIDRLQLALELGR